MWNKREIIVAVTCLAVGSTGQLVQYLVTPVSESGSAKDNVAKALAHPAAMQWAAWLDLTILFFLPALVVVAYRPAPGRPGSAGWPLSWRSAPRCRVSPTCWRPTCCMSAPFTGR